MLVAAMNKIARERNEAIESQSPQQQQVPKDMASLRMSDLKNMTPQQYEEYLARTTGGW